MGSGLEDTKIHEVVSPEDGGADGSDLLASSLVRAVREVLGSGLDLIVDRYAVEKHVLCRVDDEPLGVEEGVAHLLQLGYVIGADLLTVLHGGGDLGYELAELVDASGNLVEGAGLEVLNGSGHMGDEGVDVLDASLKAVNMLSLESTNEDTVDHLGHIKDSHGNRAILICATNTCESTGHFFTAICGIEIIRT